MNRIHINIISINTETLMGLQSLLKSIDRTPVTSFVKFQKGYSFSTALSGFVSLIMILAFGVIFAFQLLKVIQRNDITVTRVTHHSATPIEAILSTFSTTNFTMAFEVYQLDLNTGPQHFELVVDQEIEFNNERPANNTIIPLQPCTANHFRTQLVYSEKRIAKWKCLPLDYNYSMSGNSDSNVNHRYGIFLRRCERQNKNKLNCSSQSEFEDFLGINFRTFATHFINPLLNENVENFQTNERISLTQNFNQQQLSLGNLNFQSFNVTTDYGLFFFSDKRTIKGAVYSNEFKQNLGINDINDGLYVQLLLASSPTSVEIQRKFYTIIDAFSYVGGLWTPAMLLLTIFAMYNKAQYEITLANETAKRVNPNQPEFTLNFFQWLFYLCKETFCCCCSCLRRNERYQNYLELRNRSTKQSSIENIITFEVDDTVRSVSTIKLTEMVDRV